MALQPPVIAPHAATGASRNSSKGGRCGLTKTSVPLCFHLEKFQLVSRVPPAYGFHVQGRGVHSSDVALAQLNQKYSVAFKEIATSATVGEDDVLIGPDSKVSMQLERIEQPLVPQDAVSGPQEAQSLVEGLKKSSGLATTEPSAGAKGLNEPSGFATVNPNVGLNEPSGLAGDGAAQPGFSPPQPGITSFDKHSDLESLRSNAEDSVRVAGAADVSQDAATTAADSLSTDQFKSAKEAYEAMTSGTKDATDALPLDQFKSAKEAYEALLSGSKDATDRESPIDALSQASQSLAGGLSEVESTVLNGFTRVQASVQGSIDGAIAALKSTYDNMNGSIINSFNHVTGFNENARTVSESTSIKNGVSQESLVNILTSPFQMDTPVNNALKEVVSAVGNVTGKVWVRAGELVANGYSSTKELLPVDAKVYLSSIETKLIEVSGPIQIVFKQVYTIILDAEKAVGINPENPIVPILLVVGGGFSLGIVYRQSQYGGYSGDLAPASAFDLLKKEDNIVLVDIRPEDLRESQGIPDLRRQARFKAASVELFKVQGSLQRMLSNVAVAEAAITASAIKNLKNVRRNTKVMLMDSDGSQSKIVARALKKAGIKLSYRIDGGFRAWEANGLRVKQVVPETALTIIKEDTQAILDEVKPTPFGIASATLGLMAGIYALIEWEKTLQFLGLVCIGQVLYTYIKSYDTLDDAKNDLKLLLRPFSFATQGILWVAGMLEPSKLQLATSPSTSAVQDRVLQAAAKHGPVPSEYDQEQEAALPSEELTSKGLEKDSAPQE